MDGNGRWAKKRGLPRTFGHREGAKRIQRALEKFRELGVHYVTLYAFSTENWKRPREEVDTIMELAFKYLASTVAEKVESDKDFSVKFLGDKSRLPENLRNIATELEEKSRGRAFVCSVALNYGGRDEIVHAVNEAIKAGHTTLTEEIISSYTYTSTEPDPDLVIRTGGDFRTSNFLLWQSAYSEYYVTKTLWPDFDENEIIKAVTEFSSRKRRFGGLDKEDLKEQ
jgi:undecaprenyl diphosphate synthase